MQTAHEQAPVGLSTSGFKPVQSQFRISEKQVNKLKIKEFTSWSVCFGIITLFTGLLKYLKVGVTMDSVTSVLFYTSLVALAYFIYRIVSLSRNPVQIKSSGYHELN